MSHLLHIFKWFSYVIGQDNRVPIFFATLEVLCRSRRVHMIRGQMNAMKLKC